MLFALNSVPVLDSALYLQYYVFFSNIKHIAALLLCNVIVGWKMQIEQKTIAVRLTWTVFTNWLLLSS